MRKILVSLFSVACLLALGAMPSFAAQESTPATSDSLFASLGLPELNITITTSGFEGIPESLAAGRYLVTATIAEGVDPDKTVAFGQPQGMSVDDFLGALAGGGSPGMASPSADMGTPPAGGGEEDGPQMLPPFVYQAVFAGGVSGSGSASVIDLTPGSWFAWGDDPASELQPVRFEVTGEMPADLATPDSSATISLGEYVIKVTAGELKAGPQVVEIDNIGAQPHFIVVMRAPDGFTVDQVTAALQGEITGTPVAGATPITQDPEPVVYVPTQSSGVTSWTTLDLQPGVYIMMCWFPDEGDGMPHAMKGMYTAVEVAG